jgi:endonuclease/exonuclease/phosphatase family metal-dependent hydrolase
MRSRVPEPVIASFNQHQASLVEPAELASRSRARHSKSSRPLTRSFRRRQSAGAGYHAAWRGETRWNGVAILARWAPVVTRGLASRRPPMVSAATSRRPLMACLSPRSTLRMETLSQVPNSTKARMAQALDRPRGRTLRDWAPVVLAGDFNVVPTGIDIYPTKSWDRDALLQPRSRAACSPGKRRNSTTAGITPNQSPNPASRKNVHELLSRMDIARAHAQGFLLGL